MRKIVIPYLVFENERIEVPVGFSEILETAWKKRDGNEVDPTAEVVSKYERSTYKQGNGRWATKFKLR